MWLAATVAAVAAGCASGPAPLSQSPAPTPSGPAASTSVPAQAATSAARSHWSNPSGTVRPRPSEAAPASFAALRVPPGHHQVLYLTFDDGPSPFTSEVLSQLAAVHAHAVFCLVGNNAVKRPADVRAEVGAGDQLCDHSRDHSRAVASKNRRWVAAEVNDGLHEILSVDGGAKVLFYRQPFGLWTRLVVSQMYAAGLDPLRWTDDPRDWSRPGAVAVAQRVLLRLRPGAIVLMHDGGGDRSETVAALHWLLPHLLAAGWRFGLPTPQRLPPSEAARPQ